jgi:hypothetical protein
MTRINLFIIIVLILTSCGEVIDVPNPDDSDPVFGTMTELDGNNFSLTAGVDNYHVHPEFIDTGKDLIFKTTFKNRDCDRNCPKSLTFNLYSNQPLTPDFNIEKALTPGHKKYKWNTVRDSQYVVVKQQSKGSFDNSSFWYKGIKVKSNTTATETRVTVPRETKLELCLTNRSGLHGTSSQCQYIINRNQLPPRVNLKIRDARAISLVAEEIQPFDHARAEFLWSTGEKSKEIMLSKDQLINKEVCVSVKYPDQRSSKNCMNITSVPERFDLVSQFEIIAFEDIVPTNNNNQGLAEIEYIDETGNRFISRLHKQGQNQKFEIYQIEDYYDDVTDMRLKKVTLGFKCELFGSNGKTVKIESDTTTLAIRYPR